MFCNAIRHCATSTRQFHFRDVRRILVVSKTTRYENEISRDTAKLSGSDMYALRRTHEVHEATVEALVTGLQRLPWHADVKVVKSYDGLGYPTVTEEDFGNADLVFSTGGDGTFVRTASFIDGSNAPIIIGINSDPTRSEGFLCVDHNIGGTGRSPQDSDPKKRIAHILERLCAEQTTCVSRQRIRVERVPIEDSGNDVFDEKAYSSLREPGLKKLSGGERTSSTCSDDIRLRLLALNDVLLAELAAQKSSYYDFCFVPAAQRFQTSLGTVEVDKEHHEKHKSSGLLVSTGTGSSAWHRTCGGVHPKKLQRILRFASKELRAKMTPDTLRSIADEYNTSLIFPPDLGVMRFTVREPIVNGVFSCDFPSGSARSIGLRPRSDDMRIFIDGQHIAPLQSNQEVRLSVHKEDAVQCLHLPCESVYL